MKDRETAATGEIYLSGVERGRDDLQVEPAELREENDSLLAQPEATQRASSSREKFAEGMREQLAEDQMVAEAIPQDNVAARAARPASPQAEPLGGPCGRKSAID